MSETEARDIVAREVGIQPNLVPSLAREAASARRRKDWGEDCGWRSDPILGARRITIYLDSFAEND